MKYIGYVTVFLTIALLGSIAGGWTLSILWSWFVVGLFDLPPLTIPTAIGLMLVVQFFSPINDSSQSRGRKFDELMIEAVAKIFAKCGIALGCGWLVTLFI